MKKYTLNLLFVLLLSNFLFAQEEYFVQINPFTASYNIIDSLPVVKWIQGASSFDKINKRYIFYGEDVNINSHLYNINATNGSIISSQSSVNYLILMKFDNLTGILYGIQYTTTLANANFVSINPTNLTYTIINPININSLNGDVTFDDINKRFIFIGDNSFGIHCLFSIDALTGYIISEPPLSNNISGIQFDNSSGKLYGLQWDNNSHTENFASINIANGTATIINSIPIIDQNWYYSTFDEINKRYTFIWTGNSGIHYLYTINASNGLVISNPSFPAFTNTYNLIEPKYDNSSGNLYALHWGSLGEISTGIKEHNQNLGIKIYPNPARQSFNVELPQQQNFNLFVFDITGRKVVEIKNATGTIKVDCSSFNSGVYYVRAINEKTVLTNKFIKE
jgi:hypothetical protein